MPYMHDIASPLFDDACFGIHSDGLRTHTDLPAPVMAASLDGIAIEFRRAVLASNAMPACRHPNHHPIASARVIRVYDSPLRWNQRSPLDYPASLRNFLRLTTLPAASDVDGSLDSIFTDLSEPELTAVLQVRRLTGIPGRPGAHVIVTLSITRSL